MHQQYHIHILQISINVPIISMVMIVIRHAVEWLCFDSTLALAKKLFAMSAAISSPSFQSTVNSRIICSKSITLQHSQLHNSNNNNGLLCLFVVFVLCCSCSMSSSSISSCSLHRRSITTTIRSPFTTNKNTVINSNIFALFTRSAVPYLQQRQKNRYSTANRLLF